MPATEQTWRDQKLMHRIFAASGLLLLAATVWMFVVDHNREWKGHVMNARHLDLTLNSWQQDNARSEGEAKHDRLQSALLQAQSRPISKDLIDEFSAEVKAAGKGASELPTLETQRAAHDSLAQDAVKWRRAADSDQRKYEAARDQAAAAKLAAQEARSKVAGAEDAAAAKAAAKFAEETAAKADADAAKAEVKALESEGNALKAEIAARDARQQLLDTMQRIIAAARFREDKALISRKFKSAERDAKVAELGLAVRDGLPQETLDKLQGEVDVIVSGDPNDEEDGGLEGLTTDYQVASKHREDLEKTLKKITADVDAAAKNLEDAEAELNQLKSSAIGRRSTWFTTSYPLLGKKWLELPILDAFNSPLKIDNLWHEGNMIDYNFSKVRRFDRCTTCHQAIQKTQPGSATDPAYASLTTFDLVLRTPARDELPEAKDGKPLTLSQVYGFSLAEEGLLDYNAVTVSFVRPAAGDSAASALAAQATVATGPPQQTDGQKIRAAMFQSAADSADAAAAQRGLMLGDVIDSVNGQKVFSPGEVRRFLLNDLKWGDSVRLTIRRGQQQPYAGHPRLDLFVGSLSPHKMSVFACTNCHEGQGSATAFKWASHAPNDPLQAKNWADDHGWFDNHHWIYPMYPKRFAESSCLKCHHDVTELAGALISDDGSDATGRFVDSPAPNLMRGYDLVRKYGCFGCHEVNGYEGADKRVGPDLRLEPNVSEAAQQIKSDAGYAALSPEAQGWAEQLVYHPELDAARRRLYELVQADIAAAEPKLSPVSHKVAELLKDVEAPGRLRKVGPSLRRVKSKLTSEFMYDWIREPKHFRPDSRMPQFFRQWKHLEGEGKKDAERYEPIEIAGIVSYLRNYSQPFEHQKPAETNGARDRAAQIENGRIQFQNRCVACHKHREFADAEAYRGPDEIVQGPDLSEIAAKFSPEVNEDGRSWLYSWIRHPSRYNPRTLMPDLLLDPYEVPVKNEAGEPVVGPDDKPLVNKIDPIADIVEFLLAASRSEWQPVFDESVSVDKDFEIQLDEAGLKTLNELALKNLQDVFYEAAALKYLSGGIPADVGADLKGAEVELVGEGVTDEMKLLYVGRKTIAKYGCYGCHDVPGFEDAKPIGTGLADWGAKETSKLAFEHIAEYLEHGHGHHDGDHADHADEKSHTNDEEGHAAQDDEGEAANAGQLTQADRDFYHESLLGGHRAGFIWQKLAEPRSYDYHKTENKKYSERLRMPMFAFSEREREAVIAFVLGLVADPPSDSYVYKPSPRQEAILAGRRVVEKYNCGACHVLDLERWKISYAPGTYPAQPSLQTFPFVEAHFSPEQLKASAEVDRGGMLHATLTGLPTISDADGLPMVNDFEGDPLEDDDPYDPTNVSYLFDLWKPVALDGNPYQVAVLPLKVKDRQVDEKHDTRGGFLAKYLAPRVVARAKALNPTAKGSEAWGWVPPPLIGQGAKVQSDWLHDFLLDPHAIRPEVVLRMPKFNMSSEEASALVNYFSAKDNAAYPYDFSQRRRTDYLAAQQQKYLKLLEDLELPPSTRFDDARQIVFNKAGCIQCHSVGDYSQSPRGPDLSVIYKRLRSEYLRDWIAYPKRILPYTSMPENFKYLPGSPDDAGFIVTEMDGGETKKKKLVHGSGTEQLDAMVDLLMNFDLDAQQRSPFAPLAPKDVEPPAAGE